MSNPRLEYMRSYREKNKDTPQWRVSARERRQKWMASLTPEERKLHYRKKNLKNNYGMTVEQFDKMVEERDGKCDICGDVPNSLHVDHNHITGSVRGLLCVCCNTALGKFKDSATILDSAKLYVERYK